ncbi:MAG: GGDEF domain-containing protein [Bacilli bacterium]|nr:GGDEF domain-containing protein [Bacilli bacterium]
MKKDKKKLIIILSIIFVLLAIFLVSYFVLSTKNNNSLTLEENQWIDSNKKNVIDIALMNDIPVLSYDGEGLVYDYLDYVTDKLSLKFNVISYKLDGNSSYDYKMDIVDSPKETDIVLLEDNFVLITKEGIEYKDVSEIDNLKLGILAADRTKISTYFLGKNIELVDYNTYADLKGALDSPVDKETEQQTDILAVNVDGIIISKTAVTKEMIENDYKISFQFNDLNKYYVISMNGNTTLRSILNKTYENWEKNNYEDCYNKNLIENYFTFKKVSDVEQKNLKSKSYVYGFIDYGIYNYLNGDKISGLSGLILKDFNQFSGISITYTRYNSINNLLKDFNSNKVDFLLNISSSEKYQVQTNETVGVFNKQLAVISGINNLSVIDSIKSLKDKEVLVIKDSYLESYLVQNSVKVKSYNNMDDLSKDFNISDIAIVDLENYNYYKSSSFKDVKINYLFDMEDKYNYVVNNKSENQEFENLFNFYLNYESISNLVSTNYNSVAYENSNIVYLLVLIIIALCIYIVVDFSNHIKVMIKKIKKNKKVNLSKEDKLKYIDQLTSLKNRAYLNSKIESWDDSEVYPQSIIVIDLNNVSYINDNYGREEGDKVITEAANILIMHQLQNSEIIRTDGNEFLVYMVGYNEKQVISYLRRLNKEFKKLSHGFGAASGYSIINDAIKTIDDAINEATLAMKENKEDIEY